MWSDREPRHHRDRTVRLSIERLVEATDDAFSRRWAKLGIVLTQRQLWPITASKSDMVNHSQSRSDFKDSQGVVYTWAAPEDRGGSVHIFESGWMEATFSLESALVSWLVDVDDLQDCVEVLDIVMRASSLGTQEAPFGFITQL